ncbi:hypothetical protein BGX38DRAFT_1162621 [Terfezia claveryi]|nr:hypothetical protein BGX38DRAFT_1162621 [Terfezia claveryi]
MRNEVTSGLCLRIGILLFTLHNALTQLLQRLYIIQKKISLSQLALLCPPAPHFTPFHAIPSQATTTPIYKFQRGGPHPPQGGIILNAQIP